MEALLSPAVETALAALEDERDPLRIAAHLRQALGEGLGRRAAELLRLRRRAAGKLPWPERLLLTQKSLEQASAWPVARARARRIGARAPGAVVLDALAGLGGDAMALAAAGQPLVAAELDPELARFLRHNLSLAGPDRSWQVVRADVRTLAPSTGAARADVLLLDPDRRSVPGGGPRARARQADAWTPPLETALALLQAHSAGVLKLPPTWDPESRAQPPAGPHAWEWVSLGGEAKELTLWTGELAEGHRGTRGALVLTSRGEEHRLEAAASGTPRVRRPPLEALTVLAQADPAVVRAGLVGRLAVDTGLAPLGQDFPYLGGVDEPAPSPFLHVFRIRGSAPLDRKRVRELLRRFDVGPLVVKTRGVGSSAAELAERLRGPGRKRGWLVALGLEEGRRVFLVEAGTGG